MGRSRTPKYVLHMGQSGGRYYHTPQTWDVRGVYGARGRGAPTHANLVKYVRDFEASTRVGGPNVHLGPTRIAWAKIRENTGPGGKVRAVYYDAPGGPSGTGKSTAIVRAHMRKGRPVRQTIRHLSPKAKSYLGLYRKLKGGPVLTSNYPGGAAGFARRVVRSEIRLAEPVRMRNGHRRIPWGR